MELANLKQYNHNAITVGDSIRLGVLKASEVEAAPIHIGLITLLFPTPRLKEMINIQIYLILREKILSQA